MVLRNNKENSHVLSSHAVRCCLLLDAGHVFSRPASQAPVLTLHFTEDGTDVPRC